MKGWTIENEVYESIMMEDTNKKYLPNHSLKGLEATMRLDEAVEGVEIVVLALPSGVILDVFQDLLPFVRPGHVIFGFSQRIGTATNLYHNHYNTCLKKIRKIILLLYSLDQPLLLKLLMEL